MKFLLIYVPNLRFSSFTDLFRLYTLKDVLQRVSIPVNVEENKLYYQIGIRSHSKGIFHKEAETGKQIGNKRIFWIEPNCLILNIVFAWEQAVAKTSEKEVGMVASHRFPMYKVLNNSLDYIVDFFKTEKGKQLLQMASPGGAGRNKTLNQDFFLNSKIYLPSLNEQLKTSNLIELIEDRIETQIKIINDYKSLKKWINDKIYSDLKCEYLSFSSVYVIAKEGGTPSTTKPEYYSGNIPFIKIDDLNKKYITENKVNISEQGLSNSSAWIIPKNSVIMSNGATIGNVSINTYPVSTKQGILGIVPKDDVLTEYLYYLLNTTDFRRNLKQVTTKGTIDCAYIKDIDHIKVKIPELEIQKSIIQILKRIDKKIELEVLILDFINKQKQYLLNNLFV